MNNFNFYNPTRVLFGEGQIANIANFIPKNAKILLTYGGGSIKRNGCYDQVIQALKGLNFIEFSGIEPNPQYDTLMRAVELARQEGVDYILAVGGGSVLDGSKFIAGAIHFEGDTWDIVCSKRKVEKAVPLGAVLTLPATGSEMNPYAVVSRKSLGEKRGFRSDLLFPQFSVLDPSLSFTLSKRQVGNGIVDSFVHTMEQYLTYPVNAPLQDRMAESILSTLIEEGPKTYANPEDYASRANLYWSATMALNTLIGMGVPQDWTTHGIGHELTALHGIDHARTLALVLPSLMRYAKADKGAKILQYAERVWKITEGTEEERIDLAIAKTETFFHSVGVPTKFNDYDLGMETVEKVEKIFEGKGFSLGEHRKIDSAAVAEILKLSIV